MIGSKKTLAASERQVFEGIRNNNIEEVTRILGLGIDINIQNDCRRTPIFLAALYNNLSMVEKLAELGANLEVKSKLGNTVLSEIVSKKNLFKKISKKEQLAMIKALIKWGAKPTTIVHNSLPIHGAIRERSNLDVIKTLLTEDTANTKDSSGYAPLHLAVSSNRINIVKLLIKYKNTNINIQDNNGDTPLMLAAREDFIDIALLLLTRGAKPDLENTLRQTFFGLAASQEMKSLPSTVKALSSQRRESRSRANTLLSNDYESAKYKTLEDMSYVTQPRSILASLASRDNELPRPEPNSSKASQLRVLDTSTPGSSISEASQLRMLDTNTPGSSISDTSQHSTSAILGSPKSSLGSFTNKLKRTLNVDSSSSSGSYTTNPKRKKLDYAPSCTSLN